MWEEKRANWPYYMLNVRAGPFFKRWSVHCNVTRQLKTEARIGLKTDLALHQNMYR